jgi:ATP synthase F1 complex assembly factor 1
MKNLIPKFNFSFTYPCPRNLREIMKLSLIEKEPKDKIKEIWNTYHAQRFE